MSEGFSRELLELHDRALELVREGDVRVLGELLQDLHPSDLADLVETLDSEAGRLVLMRSLPLDLASETLAEMEEGVERRGLLTALDPERSAELLHELADDDAADLIAELEPSDRALILAALPVDEAGDLQGLLLYDEETAGGRMTTALVSVQKNRTANEAIDEIRRRGREVEDFYTVFVVDERNRLEGTVPLDDLVLANPATPVEELIEPVVASVLPDVDQEEVGRLLSRYNLASMPVVNEFGQLLGRVTFDDVIDVMEAEQTEDILRLAGVSEEEDLRSGWRMSVRSRLPWLTLNLFTAGAAASVVILFGDTIDQLWFLAAIMPIIAGMGGNSGTQALAVTVRLLALEDRVVGRKYEAVRKEAIVGLVNGLALGLLGAGVAWLAVTRMEGVSRLLPVVVLLALWGNMVVAGFAGAFIPTLLDKVGIDPAVASSVFVTTLTDLFGFFLLLGLASAVLL